MKTRVEKNDDNRSNIVEISANPMLRDKALLQRISEHRDRSALTQLYQAYRRSLGGFLLRRLGSEQLVQETYNDVMFTVWRKAQDFRGDSSVSTWIFGIAFRMCMAALRKEQRHRKHLLEIPIDQLPEAVTEQSTDSLEIELDALADDYRVVIELAYFYGASINEIAEIIDCPANTVKTRLFRARRKLRQTIEQVSGELKA